MDKKDQVKESRRGFLKLAVTAAPAAAAVTLTAGQVQALSAEAPADAGGLQDTAHIRAYLESTKF
ncbi:MAG TPA: twin-arginine translocation signal domain-containing protein [Aliiroseovarius sp.]|nr:twin-arginine translocation signal domain-containing protein [Aliiroseovarius sp.]